MACLNVPLVPISPCLPYTKVISLKTLYFHSFTVVIIAINNFSTLHKGSNVMPSGSDGSERYKRILVPKWIALYNKP